MTNDQPDPLSFESMRLDREMWEHCQIDEYSALVRNSSATVGTAITTRTRLEQLLLSLLRGSAKDVPAVQRELDEQPKPNLSKRIELCGTHGLVDPGIVPTMHLLRQIGNVFAHDGVISAIEPPAAPLFDRLRAEMNMMENRSAVDDVALIEKAFAHCVSSVRDWRGSATGA